MNRDDIRPGIDVEWVDAYGKITWGTVRRIDHGGLVTIEMMSRRSRAKNARNEVHFYAHEYGLLTLRSALDQHAKEGPRDAS